MKFKTDILSLSLKELSDFIVELGEKPFRARQVFKWLHQRGSSSFDEMTDISKKLRAKLEESSNIKNVSMVEKFISKEDNTTKYLFQIENDYIIESVLMKYEYGNAVCISSQAGCAMGCSFCASTIDGLERNLTAGEMLSQVYEIGKDLKERISNIVIMGSGEPLHNFDNTIKFLELINSKDGLEVGHRHITLSTCGIVEKIKELEKMRLQITLAVSLHAPNDEIRESIMPIAKRYSIDELILAAKEYADFTKRRVTFEYALIKGVNDSVECAKELAERLKGSLCHVNLIPVNDVKERNYIRSSDETVNDFYKVLKRLNIDVTVRRKLGSDINASCGQLRKKYIGNY
ncbi:MAG: 23S rRNA (adenine(2503)-C(2))-methyltransferase RlmN [Clostridiales bacterium]|nr:23S rRNA (adenine(2503)-C(2))-methyltransferase RlmN [Clostridiales bacterium]